MTTAEQRAKKMDVKHAMLAERAKQARDRCEVLAKEYVSWLHIVPLLWAVYVAPVACFFSPILFHPIVHRITGYCPQYDINLQRCALLRYLCSG